MGKINLLDTEISNKIAAGEVVERPASVVKELVENSIDAGATQIAVEIKNGGNTYIKVSDNGSGMEKDDAAAAFLRHATSKISTAEDLNAIYTLGFRGEALSSIGAVAMVDLYTKRREDETGTHTVCEGGEIVSSEDAGIPDGTTFIVKNLFFNVPARMKFLKKDAAEAGYISDIMTRFVLSHPEISFKFINNSKPVMFSQGDGKLENSIYSVYGRDYAAAMLCVNYKSEHVEVKGMTGKGSTARPNRGYQSFFVNGRYIKSPLIMRAVEEAYKNQIMIGKFPVSVLDIKIDPMMIDINVHPTKLEVKFSDESEVYRAVYNAVKEALYRIEDIPEIKRKETEKPKSVFERDSVSADAQIEIKIQETPKKEFVMKQEQTVEKKDAVEEPQLFKREINVSREEKPLKFYEETLKKLSQNQTPVVIEEKAYEKKAEIKQEIKTEEKKLSEPAEFKLVGQLFDTYIIIERRDNMQIIDQHAAHERLKYEEIRQSAVEAGVYSQTIAVPAVANLTASEMSVFLQNTDVISSLGFEAEEFGENSVIIRAVPANAEFENIENLFVEIISQLEEHKREVISDKRQRLLYTIACKAAIKANHRLDEREQKELVRKVLELDNINTCPHGRPIIISMSKKEIEKEFKRIV